MAVITTGAFGKALWPGVNAWWGQAYKEWKVEYTDLFETYRSGKNFEEDVGTSMFGLMAVKPEGQALTYDTASQGFLTRYTHTEYALGFIITQIMVEDDQYMVIAQKRARALAFSARQTKEVVGANVYNRAFNSGFTGGDNIQLLSTAHLNVAGGTWSNRLATDADVSEASFEQACIDISKWQDDRGNQIAVMPYTVIISPDQVFEVERILMSPLQSATANNDINALYSMSKFPGGVKVNHYLTDTDAWFMRTDAREGMKYFTRRDDTFAEDNDFDTKNLKYSASARYVMGWTDPRGLFGSSGA